jgi:hypothetical protein
LDYKWMLFLPILLDCGNGEQATLLKEGGIEKPKQQRPSMWRLRKERHCV